MKVKYLIPLILLFSIEISYSGEDSLHQYSFQENSSTYLFGDNVRVRSEPEINSKNVIDTLNIGDKVTIVRKTDRVMVIGGYKEFWYKISYKKNNKDSAGYIWGGLLSFGFSVKDNKLFLAGMKNYSKDSGFTAECRLLENGKLISSVAFSPHYLPDGLNEGVYDYSVSTGLEGGHGLEGVDNIFRIYFNYEACGYPRGNVWIGYGNKKLFFIGKDTSVSEAGVFHAEEKYIFPDENRSGKNTVILITENYDFDESINDYKLSERKETGFIWKNNTLEEIK